MSTQPPPQPPPQQPWRPLCPLTALQQRAQCYRQIRDYFARHNVLEVETPQLASAAVSDPQIESISAQLTPGATPKYWLRTSPEYFHKRLLAAGSGDIYELGKVFRAGEAGRWHNPEFTMLEWYRVGWHYHQLMDEVEKLVRLLLGEQSTAWASERISYRDLHRKLLHIDPFTMPHQEWVSLAREHGYTHAENESLAGLQDFVYGVAIRQHLPERQLTFIYDYPLNQAALARVRHDDSPVAERFELFLGQVEIANGYQELTDAQEQSQRFANDLSLRQTHHQTTAPLDQHLLAALRHGLPECSGVALGVDRLLAQASAANSLAEVLPFNISNS